VEPSQIASVTGLGLRRQTQSRHGKSLLTLSGMRLTSPEQTRALWKPEIRAVQQELPLSRLEAPSDHTKERKRPRPASLQIEPEPG